MNTNININPNNRPDFISYSRIETPRSVESGSWSRNNTNVTGADNRPVSSAQHVNIRRVRSNSRSNSQILDQLMQPAHNPPTATNNPDPAEVIEQIATVHTKLNSIQASVWSGLERQAFKLHMLGLACQLSENVPLRRIFESMQDSLPDAQSLKFPFDEHQFSGTEVEQCVDRLTALDDLFRQALDSGAVPEDAKEHIKRAHDRFKDDTRQIVNDYEVRITSLETEMTNAGSTRDNVQIPADERNQAHLAHVRAQNELESTKADLKYLKEYATDYIFLNETIASNEAAASGFGTKVRAAWGQGLPASVLSAIHFGLIKALIDDQLQATSTTSQVAGGGAGLGLAHKFVNDTAKPILVYAAQQSGGLGVRAVDPDSVYPRIPKVVTENGKVHKRNAEALKKMNDANDLKKANFKAKQATHKLPTLMGEIEAQSSYAIGHLLARGIPVALEWTKATHPGFRVAGSAFGGLFMGGGQAFLQLSQKVDDRRTHVTVKPNPDIKNTVKDTQKGLMNTTNLMDSATREEYLSRIFGSMELYAVVKGIQNVTGESMAGKLAGLGLGYIPGLTPFFANLMAGAEVKAGDYPDEPVARISNARRNLTEPGRPDLPHSTDPDTWLRMIEDTFQRARGLTQAAPQAGAVFLEGLISQLLGQHKSSDGTGEASSAVTTARPGEAYDVDGNPPPDNTDNLNVELGLRSSRASGRSDGSVEL